MMPSISKILRIEEVSRTREDEMRASLSRGCLMCLGSIGKAKGLRVNLLSVKSMNFYC